MFNAGGRLSKRSTAARRRVGKVGRVVYWNDAGRGYMLIGKASRAALEAYAGELAPRV